MTPRSLAQNPGGVYSTPQGTDLKFLVVGAHLPMWMASASYKVGRKGSTMYNTPSILVQLGEHDVCMSTSCQERVTSQSNLLTLLIRKRVARFLLSSNTLADLGFNQGGILSTIWAIHHQLGPPMDAKIVMCATRDDDVSHQWRYASEDVDLLQTEQCSLAPTERRTVL